jgi:hypothetical protein
MTFKIARWNWILNRCLVAALPGSASNIASAPFGAMLDGVVRGRYLGMKNGVSDNVSQTHNTLRKRDAS